ncbi:MAG: protein BatD [Chlorobi bacterium]|nr:protein BatD [Chlorobiota bacterium]
MVRTMLIVGLLLIAQIVGAQPRIEASVVPQEVQVGETFQVIYSIEGDFQRFVPPSFEGLRVVAGPISSTSVQIINGRFSKKAEFKFIVKALKSGEFVIDGGFVIARGRRYDLPAVRVYVTDGKPMAQGKQDEGKQQTQVESTEDIFIVAEVDNPNPFVGQQVRVRYKLYSRYPVQNLNTTYVPNNSGVWTYGDVIKKKLELEQETLNGQPYYVVDLAEYFIFPQKAGVLWLDSFGLDIVVLMPQEDPFFDEFFRPFKEDPFFRNVMPSFITHEPVSVHVSGGRKRLNVKPLPEPIPEDFSGLVGRWQAELNVSPTEVPAGEPITYELTVKGRGNVKALRLNKPPIDSSLFEVYDPEVRDKTNIGRYGVSGRRKIKWILIPKDTGTLIIPQWTFSYFNPHKQTYERITINEVKIHVTGDGSLPIAEESQQDSQQAIEKPSFLSKDKIFLIVKLIGGSLLFIALASILVAIIRKQKKKREERRRVVAREISQLLEQANLLLQKGDYEQFLSTLYDALWKFGANTVDDYSDAMTSQEIARILETKIGKERATQWLSLIRNIETELYSPVPMRKDKTKYKDWLDQAKNIISN